MEGEEEADDGGEEESGSVEIEFGDLFAPGRLLLAAFALDVEEGDDEGRRDGAEWEVDVEAPAPSQLVSEDSAKSG